MLSLGVIKPVEYVFEQLVLPTFVRQKKNSNDDRMILKQKKVKH